MIRIRSGDTVTELAWTGENIPAARLLGGDELFDGLFVGSKDFAFCFEGIRERVGAGFVGLDFGDEGLEVAFAHLNGVIVCFRDCRERRAGPERTR